MIFPAFDTRFGHSSAEIRWISGARRISARPLVQYGDLEQCGDGSEPMKSIIPTKVLFEPHSHEHEIFYRTILERTRDLVPLRVAVVHPVDRNALLGAVEAAQ